MPDWKLQTPVAFFIFNRPETSEMVFAEIAKAKPPMLLVVADGPRADRSGESDKCASTRAIIDRVDWDCQVLTNYSDTNMGCRRRMSSGLDWVFASVEEAIVLEDDCLPSLSFFRFCEDLLIKYRYDQRIGQIGGVNFQFGSRRSPDSYYYSRHNHIWGWASWRRAWNYYDVNLALWPVVRDGNWLKDILGDDGAVEHWRHIFERVARGKIDTWDYQWTFACWVNNALTILPNENLISNIGFGPGATHTTRVSKLANIERGEVAFPLAHPRIVVRDAFADDFTASFDQATLVTRAWRRLGRILG